jgi:crotonobetaine/carnitine-CoA ligase
MAHLWMHTGDLGRTDGTNLYFVDRKKDYLRSRGEKISSFEIERAFMRHDAVSEVAAHDLGKDLRLWAIDNLPYFAVPQFIELRDELPKTPTGKITKHVLRAEGRTSTTWDRDDAGVAVRRVR